MRGDSPSYESNAAGAVYPWLEGRAANHVNAALHELASAMESSAFTADEAAEAVGARGPIDLLTNSARYAYATDAAIDGLYESAVGVLTQVFILNGKVPADVFSARVSKDVRRVLERAQLTRRFGDAVSGSVTVTPFGGQYFLSDSIFRSDFQGRLSFAGSSSRVMPPHESSFCLLSAVASKSRAVKFIDLGCGSGFFGIRLGGACKSVEAIDINSRALGYTNCNAVINGVFLTASRGDALTMRIDDPDDFHLVFNVPAGVTYSSQRQEIGEMDARAALLAVARLRSAGTSRSIAQVFLVLQIPSHTPSAAALINSWLQTTPVNEWDVQELPQSSFAIPRQAVADGTIDSRSMLLRESADRDELARYLLRHDVKEVIPVVVTLSL